MRRLWLLATAAMLVASLVVGSDLAAPPSSGAGQGAPPPWSPPGPQARNAIVFLVDDMSDFSCAQARAFLPRSSRWLRDRGTCYENAATATPVCCPARAQVQTGQLAHNNRVRTQLDARRLDAADTVQHDLRAAGLRTYGIGKNLNGVNAADYYGPDARDSGFEDVDFWNSYYHEPGSFRLYDDTGATYLPDDGLYSTETSGAFLDAALDEYLATGERFYVYNALFAPHKQEMGAGPDSLPVPTPAHARSPVPPFRYAPEPDARDKLGIFARPKRSVAYFRQLWAARIRALYDVDDQMAATFARLEAAGVLDETAVIFTSDNGYTDRGQANWEGKAIPYPASTDIPMLAWYPGAAPAVVERGVQLIDVAPTLYDVLEVTPGHRLDGHSLRGGHVRDHQYGEFYGERDELVLHESGRATGFVPSWRLLKRGPWSYVVWYATSGRIRARELYRDPRMVTNVLWKGHRGRRPGPDLVRSLHRSLVAFSRCAGTQELGARRPCT